jgi:hypothetical protein
VAPVILRGSTCEIHVEPDGSYAVVRGRPAPEALIVLDRQGGAPRTRAVIDPGGVANIDEVRVELSREAGETRPEIVDVRYSLGDGWASVPVRESLSQVDFRAEVGIRPAVFYVHASVENMNLRRFSDGQERTVRLPGDRVVRIVLDELFQVQVRERP